MNEHKIHKCPGAIIPSLKFIIIKWFWKKFSKSGIKKPGYLLSSLYVIPEEVGIYIDNNKNVNFEETDNVEKILNPKNPFQKYYIISNELAECLILEEPYATRKYVLNQLWTFIKWLQQNPSSSHHMYIIQHLLNINDNNITYRELQKCLKAHFLPLHIKCKYCRTSNCEKLKFSIHNRHKKIYEHRHKKG